MIAFALIYAPVSLAIGVMMNMYSRKNEFEADHFAKTTYHASPLISALKKLSTDSLSNLNPHPWYVFFYYSHPPLLQRLNALETPNL
jgi:STE24 endopeptidase